MCFPSCLVRNIQCKFGYDIYLKTSIACVEVDFLKVLLYKNFHTMFSVNILKAAQNRKEF